MVTWKFTWASPESLQQCWRTPLSAMGLPGLHLYFRNYEVRHNISDLLGGKGQTRLSSLTWRVPAGLNGMMLLGYKGKLFSLNLLIWVVWTALKQKKTTLKGSVPNIGIIKDKRVYLLGSYSKMPILIQEHGVLQKITNTKRQEKTNKQTTKIKTTQRKQTKMLNKTTNK